MTSINSLKKLVKNKDLLEQALTHKSWVNEHSNSRESNERLEFLGDAILEFVVSNEIYNSFPDKEEGYLTALRASLVNTKNLAEVAKKLDVGANLYLSKGEEETGGRENISLLADTVEAIIGALYLDGGLTLVKEFIQTNLLRDVAEKIAQPLKDPKSRLQELVQSRKEPTPRYVVIDESGPDHSKSFIVEVKINHQTLGKGSGKSKSEAEQAAAINALKLLSENQL